jgi:hypothetical protein
MTLEALAQPVGGSALRKGMLRCGVEVAWGFQWYDVIWRTTKKVKGEVLISWHIHLGIPDLMATKKR